MKLVSKAALAAAVVLGSASIAPLAPAAAQQAVAELGAGERASLLALQTALETKNYSAATSALSAAQGAARSGYARYLASALQLRLGIETNNIGLQSTAMDAILSSGSAPAAELPLLHRNRGALLQNAGKLADAEAAFTRWLELAPNDPEAMIALSQVKLDRKKTAESLALLGRAIDARRATGQQVPEGWYKRAARLSYDSLLPGESMRYTRALVAAYPTKENWRDAVLVYRDFMKTDEAANLDLMRLLRSSKAMAGERDYMELAQTLSSRGFNRESKAVLDEGVGADMIDPTKPVSKALMTASGKAAASKASLAALRAKALAATTGSEALSAGDAFFGSGEHAAAAELYRAAIQKGTIDTNVANMRLGMALALAGQRSEAEAALRTVTGPRAELASLWMLWLAQRA